MELAAKFFEATLAARTGAKARGYLADRGIDPATQLKFRLGYAPAERFALKEHLGSHGIPVEDMVEAGLLIAGDDIPVPFDRFRDRVMFPITDLRGRVIAFGGRALEKDAQAKYLNSPETPLFHKGGTLYNIAAARAGRARRARPIDRGRRLCRRHRHGERRLRRDGRAARHRAHRRPARACSGRWPTSRCSASTATPPACAPPIARSIWRCRGCMPGKSLKFALLPEGQDPDDLLRSGGREAIADVIAAARPLADMLWVRETEGHQFDTPERRAALEARLNEVTSGDRRRFGAQILPAGFQRAAVAVLRAGAGRRAASRAGRRSRIGASGAESAARARRPPRNGLRAAIAVRQGRALCGRQPRSWPQARCMRGTAQPCRCARR